MTTSRKTPNAAAVERLMRAELQDILTASPDELKAMVRATGEDPDEVVPAMRKAVLQRPAEHDATRQPLAITASAAGPQLNQISRIIDKVINWKLLAARLFEVGDGSIGNARQAFAKSASKRDSSRAPKSSNFRKWRQDNLLLTLSLGDQPSNTVTLAVEGPTELKVARLCWIDEDALAGDLSAPPRVVSFHVDPIDAGTYRVAMKTGELSRRLLAIAAAKSHAGKGDMDPRFLLPFIEME